ncbi:MAG: alpha-1,6-mannosyltransferase [Lentimonas sp.]
MFRLKTFSALSLGILFLISLFFISSDSDRQSFSFLILAYFVSFACYLALILLKADNRILLALTALGVLICCISPPFLSNDYYRFLWDGELLNSGISPFSKIPNEVLIDSTYLSQLRSGMGELSRANYSCYPPINQLYFYIATCFSDSLFVNTTVLRLLIVLSGMMGFVFFRRILSHLKLDIRIAFLFFLNPLVLIESIANVHFELVMVAWLMGAIYFIVKKEILKAGILFALAIQIKLIPLLFIPFVLRYLDWKKWISFGLITIAINGVLFYLWFNEETLAHFFESLQLYFKQFEFNSILLYPYLMYGEWQYGWNLTDLFAPRLAYWSLFILSALAFYGGKIEKETLIKRLIIASIIYLIFTSTVHPWYWILALGLMTLQPSLTVLLATGLTVLSYGTYKFGNDFDFRLILMGANFLIIALFLSEYVFFKAKIQRFKKNYLDFSLSGTGS